MGIMDNISQNKTSGVREREWVKSGDTVGKRSKEGERNRGNPPGLSSILMATSD